MSNENNVADRIALQDVMLKYAAGVDERDFDLYASCFLENVEVVDFGEAPINGRDEWVEYVKGALDNYGPTQHMLGPQLATIDGNNAHCRTDVQALHYLKQPEAKYLHFGQLMRRIWYVLMKVGKYPNIDLYQEVSDNNKKGIK